MKIKQILVLMVFVSILAAWFFFDLGQYFSLDYVKGSKEQFLSGYASSPVPYLVGYFVIYVLVTAFSVPGAAVMTLVGGAIFGPVVGVILVSFASAIGATLSMLVSRTLLRDWVQSRYGAQLSTINKGIEKEGNLYLFMLRLIPVFPFFAVNLLMGLTPIKILPYYLVSQIGMLAGTIVYVFAGAQLGEVDSIGDLLSLDLFLAFTAIGVLPLISKKIGNYIRSRRQLKGFTKPKSFDDNLIVIGAGSGGLIAALIAATVKAKVTLIEKHKMGGDCLNTGCVPSKTLIRSGKVAYTIRNAEKYGLEPTEAKVDFKKVMERVQAAIAKIEPNDSVERYTSLGVNCIHGEAKFVDPWTIEINGERRTARRFVIASGGYPFVPPIPGIEKVDVLTSDSFWDLRELPQKFLVIGGGPIGCELSQAMSRLGAEVTVVNGMERILPREDVEVSEFMHEKMIDESMQVLLNQRAKEFVDANTLIVESTIDGRQTTVNFDRVLIAAGRRPSTAGLNFDKIRLEFTKRGTIAVNEYMQTNLPHIYACGDVVGPYQFTHMAGHQAWYAAVNALFGFLWKFKVDYRIVPWCTYMDPEIARVGLNELEAKEKNIPYEVTKFDFAESDRAIAEGADSGFIKVLTPPGSDKVLGVTIVGIIAGELVSEYVVAMKHGLTLKKIMATIHTYPTMSEVNKFVASTWRRNHAPVEAMKKLTKFHDWMR